MALVKLYGNLRQLAGKPTFLIDGKSVMEVLVSLRQQHLTLVEAILEGSDLKPFYKIMVNGHDIALLQGLATAVQADDVIAIFPPIAGGSIRKG
jgi:molybdopterin synthase sulfur carrier subunit